MQKPTFIFFKMPWCGHCVTFDEGRGPQQPAQWPLLDNDNELKSLVNVKRIVWNGNPQRGEVIPLPEKYQGLVNYGPFFWFEYGTDQQGKPQGVIYRGEPKAKSIKEWILNTLKNDSNFSSLSQKKERPVVAAVNNGTKAPSPVPQPKQRGRVQIENVDNTKPTPSPHTAPGTGSSQFSYNRPGTQKRQVFIESNDDQ